MYPRAALHWYVRMVGSMGQHHHPRPVRAKVSAKWEINVYCGWIELNSYNYTNSPGISGTGAKLGNLRAAPQ